MKGEPSGNPEVGQIAGFTLIEMLIASLILAIALTALLQLHVSSLRTEELTRGVGWATRVAQRKMAETLAAGRLVDGGSGEEAAEGFPGVLRWTIRMAPADLREFRGVRGVSVVTVRVTDPGGLVPAVELVSYAAARD